MYNMDLETIVGVIFLYITMITLIIILVKDDVKGIYGKRFNKHNFQPPPPPKMNADLYCEYCQSIVLKTERNCNSCGAANKNFKVIEMPIFPKDRTGMY